MAQCDMFTEFLDLLSNDLSFIVVRVLTPVELLLLQAKTEAANVDKAAAVAIGRDGSELVNPLSLCMLLDQVATSISLTSSNLQCSSLGVDLDTPPAPAHTRCSINPSTLGFNLLPIAFAVYMHYVLLSYLQSLPDKSILIGDGGDFVASAAYTMRPRGPLGWLDPGMLLLHVLIFSNHAFVSRLSTGTQGRARVTPARSHLATGIVLVCAHAVASACRRNYCCHHLGCFEATLLYGARSLAV